MGRGRAQLILAALAAGPAGPVAAQCLPDQVELRGPAGQSRFHVEVADDPAEQAQGLMGRERLALSSGMLFVFPEPKRAQFWMRNTLIPLDMIFADAAGRVTHVHSNAVPLDETPIDGGEGVAFVLEINGGLAARMSIAPGAEMRHPAIDPDLASWSCTLP